MVTKLKSILQVLNKNLRNQRTLRYLKNYLQLLDNSTETSNVKQGVQNLTVNLFEHVHCPSFFRPVQTLCNLVPRSSPL